VQNPLLEIAPDEEEEKINQGEEESKVSINEKDFTSFNQFDYNIKILYT
jgi:hypothetical protein